MWWICVLWFSSWPFPSLQFTNFDVLLYCEEEKMCKWFHCRFFNFPGSSAPVMLRHSAKTLCLRPLLWGWNCRNRTYRAVAPKECSSLTSFFLMMPHPYFSSLSDQLPLPFCQITKSVYFLSLLCCTILIYHITSTLAIILLIIRHTLSH